jgi:putative hydrolase of the HAD superfamily
VDNEALGDQIADAYTFEKDRAIYPLPGAIETIRYLKKSGLKLALVTNGASDTQQKKISRFCLGALFDYILIEGEFGEGKPCPAVFRAAMAALGVTAPETCMVGDDLERDIKGAQSLGIRGVWVDWRGVGLKSKSTIKPDDVMRSLTQLPSVLRVPIQGQGA